MNKELTELVQLCTKYPKRHYMSTGRDSHGTKEWFSVPIEQAEFKGRTHYLMWKEPRVPQYLQELAKVIGKYGTIAGGAARSIVEDREPNDIDVFCIRKEDFDILCEIVAEHTNLSGDWCDTRQYGFVRFGKITVIVPKKIGKRKLYGNPIELIQDFDIDITKLYISQSGSIEGDIINIAYSIDDKYFKFDHHKDSKVRIASRAAKYASYGYTLLGAEVSYPVGSSCS